MNLANKMTVFRILLIPVFVTLILYARPRLALFVFFIATISDAVDGYIARTWNQKTELGAMLDPIADKLLIISAFVCLVFVQDVSFKFTFPPYVPIVVISRDIIILLGSVMIYVLKGGIEIKPSILGKATTFLQMLTVIFVLGGLKYMACVWNIMVVFTVISGAQYLIRGTAMLGNNS